MNRLTWIVCGFTMAFAVSWLLGPSTAADKKDKEDTSIKDLMIKTHKGSEAPLVKLDEALKADKVSWEDIQKNAKPLVELGKRLENYQERYTSGAAYAKNAKGLGAAVEKQDKEASAKAFQGLKSTCASCHRKMPDLK